MNRTELINSFKSYKDSDTLSHAYLLECESQKDLEEVFLDILLNYFCSDDGCKNCSICSSILKNENVNFFSLGNGSELIKKSDVLELIDFVNRTLVTKDQRKVYLIKNAENLKQDASNAILKTLEEPPKNVISFLLTNNSSEIIPTIKSRCKFYFLDVKKSELNDNELVDLIENKKKNDLFLYASKLKKKSKQDIILILQDAFEKIIMKKYLKLADDFYESIFIIKKFANFNYAIESLFIKIYEVI